MTVLIVPVSQVNRLGTIPQPDNIVVLPTLAPYRKFLVKIHSSPHCCQFW